MAQTIDTLTTRLEADISKFEEKMKKAASTMDSTASHIVKKHKEIEHSSGLMGEGVGKAMDKVFESSRLTVLEEGGARLAVFGGALEALGPIGLAAAAALGAVGIAAEEAHKAMEWAEELKKTASAIGTSTDQLQKFDYASVSTGIGIEKGREALVQFNQEIGAYILHAGDNRIAKFAQAMHLTRAEAAAAHDPIERLQLVLEKIQSIQDPAGRTRIADALGLMNLLPVINGGPEKIEEFTKAMREAQSAGGVVSSQDIQRAEELNEKVSQMTYLMGAQFKQIFIDLAPAIEKVAEFLESCTHALAKFIGEIPDAIRGLSDLLGLSQQSGGEQGGAHLGTAVKEAAKQSIMNMVPGGSIAAQVVGAGWGALVNRGHEIEMRQRMIDLVNGKYEHQYPAPFQTQTPVADPNAGKKALEKQLANYDQTIAAQKEGLQMVAEELKARQQLTADATIRADIEDQLAQNALEQKKLELQKKDTDADYAAKLGKITQKTDALIHQEDDKARTNAEIVAELQKQYREHQRATAKLQENTALQDKLSGMYSQIAQMRAAMAPTAAQRNAILTKDLLDRQRNERNDYQNYIDNLKENDPAYYASHQSGLDAEWNGMLDRQAAERSKMQFDQAGPVAQYLRGLQDVNTELENVKVQGLQGLTDGIVSAISHTKSLGAAFHDVAQQIIADLLRIAVQRAITQPLANMLFGRPDGSGGNEGGLVSAGVHAIGSMFHFGAYASGTDYASGGVAMVGENGPELVSLGRGSQVLPNNLLRNIAHAGTAHLSSPQVFNFSYNINASNALLRSDLDRQMMMFTAHGVDLAKQQIMSELTKQSRNRLM